MGNPLPFHNYLFIIAEGASTVQTFFPLVNSCPMKYNIGIPIAKEQCYEK